MNLSEWWHKQINEPVWKQFREIVSFNWLKDWILPTLNAVFAAERSFEMAHVFTVSLNFTLAANHIWLHMIQYIAQLPNLSQCIKSCIPKPVFSTGIASVCFLCLVVWSDSVCHPRFVRRYQRSSKALLFHTSEDSGYSCRKNPVVFVRCAFCAVDQTLTWHPSRHPGITLSHPYFSFLLFLSFSPYCVFSVHDLFVYDKFC